MENKETIENILELNGLDPKYWMEKLSNIGIYDCNQLQNAGLDDYAKIRDSVRHPWERKALKTCFHHKVTEIESIEQILEQNGLEKEFWMEKFQTIGITKKNQLQHANFNDLQAVSKHVRHSWEKKALRACFNDTNISERESIEDILEKNGLEVKYWLNKFGDSGIEVCEQLQHADIEVFNKLCQCKRKHWEKNALKACFSSLKNISDEEKTKQTNENVDCSPVEKKQLPDIKSSFDILAGQKNLHKEKGKIDILSKDLHEREQLTSSEIVTKISSGQILRGYFIHKDITESVVPRKKLINIPEEVELLAPVMAETFLSKEFFCEEKAGLFDHVVKYWGIKAATSFGNIGIFNVDFASSLDDRDEGSRNEVSQNGYTEIKEIVTVPTASFSLENVSHYISSEALEELIKLEQGILNAKNGEITTDLCVAFFNAFGTHYFAGMYHFGGRFIRSVICRSETKMTKRDSIKLSKWAMQTGGRGMIEWFTFSGQVGYEQSKDENKIKYREDEHYKVEKKIVKCGGPAETDSIPEWKLGLVKYPNTWHIISSDVHKTEWKGVWELLKDDLKSNFQDIEYLRNTLKKEWEILGKSTK